MKQYSLVIKLLSLFLFCWAFTIGQQSLTPINLGESRKSSGNIDVKHIILDLKFNWDKKQAYGLAIIHLAPLRKTV